jgi:hypothetical protein
MDELEQFMKKENMGEEKMQYLQFIQDVITRHNTNSFKIKELTITIIAAIFGIYIVNKKMPELILISYFTTFFLWLLDSQYLKQERQFRKLYDDAILDKTAIYSMDIRPYKVSFKEILFSKTMRTFYMPLIVTTIVIFIFLCLGK